jgi:hypothetical protein
MVSFARLSAASIGTPPSSTAAVPAWLRAVVVVPPQIPDAAQQLHPCPHPLQPDCFLDFRKIPDLHLVLQELGREATDPRNMASLETVLSQFGRPREESVARAILMMAASSSSSSELSAAETPTVFQMFCLFSAEGVAALKQPTSSPAMDPNDWNPETLVRVVQVLAASSGTPLDWPAVIRGFDILC